MAQWIVEGADKVTGKEAQLWVEAPSAQAAREVGAEKGLLVAEVRAVVQGVVEYQRGRLEESLAAKRCRRAARVLEWVGWGFFVVAGLQTLWVVFPAGIHVRSLTGSFAFLRAGSEMLSIAVCGAGCWGGAGILRVVEEWHCGRHGTKEGQ